MKARVEGAAGWALSALLHGALFAGLAVTRPPPRPRGEVVSVEIQETAPPPKEAPKPPPPPRPEPRRVAVARPQPPARDLPPPPPNQPPPPDAPPARKTPIRVGVSLSATTGAGAFAAPVGNTLYGKAPEQAPDPAEVKAYRAERYAPPTDVTRLPRTIACQTRPADYPAEAREAGLERTVKVRILVDEEGRVREAKALSDPGLGLGKAAEAVAMGSCRFEPASRNGQPVATHIVIDIRFELPN